MLGEAKAYVRSLLDAAHRRRRARTLRGTRPHVTASDLRCGFESLGLCTGDTVMLHSSLKSIGFVEGGPRVVLDALIDTIGPAGTLVVPVYWLPAGTIFATCQLTDYVFDPRRHGTHLGRLPAEFLRFDGVARSIHPTHSVAAIGRNARFVVDDHHRAPSIFGAGSPWTRCEDLGAKVVGLGVSMGPVTWYHLIEDRMLDRFPLPVRMPTTFELPCIGPDGRRVDVPIVPLDPAFMSRRIDAPGRDDLRAYFSDEFERQGLMRRGLVGEAASWVIEARQFSAHLARLVDEGITIYATAAQLAARPVGVSA